MAASDATARPVILIPPTHVPADEDIRLAQNYADAVIRAGGAPVILPLSTDASVYETLFALADGVLLTGGHDVDRARYAGRDQDADDSRVASTAGEKHGAASNGAALGEKGAGAPSRQAVPSESAQRLGASGDITPLRDEVEYALLGYAFARNLPVYGICRGIQILNVYLGGTLWEDLPTRYEPVWPAWAQEAPAGKDAASADNGSAAEPCALLTHNLHKENGDYDGDSYAHDALLAPGSRTAELFGCTRMPVNSLHHQALRTVAPELAVTAVAPDGVIEAVEHRDRPNVMAVQWHPEYFACADEKDDGRMSRFFSALVADARAARALRQRA